jgi:hypothetical protein
LRHEGGGDGVSGRGHPVLLSDRCRVSTLPARPRPCWPPAASPSRFWLRFDGLVIAICLPALVAVLAPLGEQTAGPLLVSGLPWGIVLVVLSRFVLFDGHDVDPGSTEDDDHGPGPGGDGRPSYQGRSAGFRCQTRNLPRCVYASIARRGEDGAPVDRFASGNASCHGCGRRGCGRRGLPRLRLPVHTDELAFAMHYGQPRTGHGWA